MLITSSRFPTMLIRFTPLHRAIPDGYIWHSRTSPDSRTHRPSRHKNAVHIHHVVDHNGVITPLRQARSHIIHLAAQQIKVLLNITIQYRHLKFDGKHRRTILTLGFDLLTFGSARNSSSIV